MVDHLFLFLSFLARLGCGEDLDLYQVLGVDDTATDGEIKRAYRALSKQHHPDKGGDVRKFKELSAAYEVLSDGEKRSLYDAGARHETSHLYKRLPK